MTCEQVSGERGGSGLGSACRHYRLSVAKGSGYKHYQLSVAKESGCKHYQLSLLRAVVETAG